MSKELVHYEQAGLGDDGIDSAKPEFVASFERMLRAKIPLSVLGARFGDTLLLRFTIFHDQLPLDSLPAQGWMELPVIGEDQMLEAGDQVW